MQTGLIEWFDGPSDEHGVQYSYSSRVAFRDCSHRTTRGRFVIVRTLDVHTTHTYDTRNDDCGYPKPFIERKDTTVLYHVSFVVEDALGNGASYTAQEFNRRTGERQNYFRTLSESQSDIQNYMLPYLDPDSLGQQVYVYDSCRGCTGCLK